MISEAKLRKLLAQRSESRNLDFKERLNWNSTSNDEKCQLIKDILAFLNTDDGGVIILGVHDRTLELVGLSEDEFTSFDATKLNDLLHKYTDPISSCEVQKFVIDDRRVVVIGVPEFKDVPVICKRDANSSRNQSKLILKAGGLYVRTDKATSGVVSSAEAMRDLIDRALPKRSDQQLKPIEAMIQRVVEVYQQNVDGERHSKQLRQVVSNLGKRHSKRLRQVVSNLEKSYDITLEALGTALDLKDSENEGHSKRVTAYTIAIARAMGLNHDQIRTIARGAFLHDIGNMAIPDEILKKPGKLDPEETAIMREHCYRGYRIVRRIPFLSEAAEIIFAHQEKFDGTGYPRGLKGEEIPLGARIFSIADTLDAMTSDRPYRARLPLSAARDEIIRWSGRQFDPKLVTVFLNMPENIWVDLRQDIEQQ
jgi:putative nucleotidyltransferase with HDIG domain